MVRQIMTTDEMKGLLSRALVGRLGTCKDNQPYVVPVCFVYYEGKIYFHGAPQGRKMENMRANPSVCFQVDEHQLVPAPTACSFTMHYQSVIAFGKVRFITDSEEKIKILKEMMSKYDATKLAKLDDTLIHQLEVGEIIVEKMTGKLNK